MWIYSFNMSTAVAQVCDSGILDDIDPQNITDCEHCAEYMKLVMGESKSVFLRCSFFTTVNRCSELFKTVVTEEGVCFVYNSLEVFRDTKEFDDKFNEDWTLEGGYKNTTDPLNVYPQVGTKSLLVVSSIIESGMIDGICKNGLQAFKIYLHLPNEVPQTSKHFYFMPYNHYTSIAIVPKVTVTKPELRDFSVEKRQCYFSDERSLRFFRHYTQNNCEIECLANWTLTRCGCLMFYMPSKFRTHLTPQSRVIYTVMKNFGFLQPKHFVLLTCHLKSSKFEVFPLKSVGRLVHWSPASTLSP
jgi:acid-sensing ion channel, other